MELASSLHLTMRYQRSPESQYLACVVYRNVVRSQAIRQPLHSVKHVAHFGVELKNVMFGKSALAPESDDRRFHDPAWSRNPLYKRYLQTYLAWRKELHDWIGDSNLSEQDISR